jgi:imidazolonepropionase-like amidohydrolase
VAGFTDIGIVEVMGAHEGNDTRAPKSPFSAGLDISSAVNPRSAVLGLERSGGVTRAIVSPAAAASIFGGQGAVIGLGSEPITRPRAFEYVELGEEGGQNAGGSRPAAFAMLRDALAQSEEYRRNPSGFGGREKDSLVKRSDAEALAAVLEGKMPLLAHVERASDILAVLALRNEYPKLQLVLLGATEGWMVAQQIAAAHVSVIAAALADLPEDFERLGATESNVGRLDRAGVQVAISTINQTEPPQQRRLTQLAGNLVGFGRLLGATGLEWGPAFATITSRPAHALGLDGEIGSLRPGRRADVVIWDHDPLELSSAPVMIFIDGMPQSISSRETELRDRYMTPSEGNLPKAYER